MNDTEKDIRIKRLVYRANHRGIKEMDIILGRFANAGLHKLENGLLDQFENLLGEHDRDLLVWFTGEAPFPDDKNREIFKMIEHFTMKAAKHG